MNQYEQVTGGSITDLSYDEDGNLVGYSKDGKQLTLTFNAENRLVVVEPVTPGVGDSRSEFAYDYMGRRVSKTVSSWDGTSWQLADTGYFVYDGWNLIAELDGAGVTEAAYIWGLDLSQSLQGAGGIGGLLARVDVAQDKTHFYGYDGNGNVGQLVDAVDGSLAAGYEYDPYGNILKAAGALAEVNPFRFSTKYFDGETGLYYYGYRYYVPELGRWNRKDPLGEEGGLNLYGFVGNEPVSHFDLFGLQESLIGPRAGKIPVTKDCSYYRNRYNDFVKRNEANVKNGCMKPPTYYLDYGEKYCERFSTITYPVLSDEGKEWLTKALRYLQQFMEIEIHKDDLIEYEDDRFTDMAFATHEPAYWKAGFHDMSFLDKIYVAATPDIDEWMKDSTGWYTWKQGILMGKNEIVEYFTHPWDIGIDAAVGVIDIGKLISGNGPIDRLEKEGASCPR